MLPFVSANLHIFRLPGPTSPKCIQNWHGIQPTEYSISLNKYCKTMVGFSFILCPSIMHQEALVLPSYRPTYVVCKNMSMGEMEKPSIQSFKVTIDHSHARQFLKLHSLKQKYRIDAHRTPAFYKNMRVSNEICGVLIKFLLIKGTFEAKKWRFIQICLKWSSNQDWPSICVDTVTKRN